MKPLILPFSPTYTRGSGLTGINIDSIPFPGDFVLKELNLITMPPGATGGNHKHPRREAFVVFGSGLSLDWLDGNDALHTMEMQPQTLYVMPPYMPPCRDKHRSHSRNSA